jgi:hypothetical protein
MIINLNYYIIFLLTLASLTRMAGGYGGVVVGG